MERKIVVVAPTYNEEENIAAFIEAVSKYPVTLLISDSHSSDKTPQIVKKYKNVYYLDVKKRGLGLGLSEGLNYAVNKLGADVLITMEADMSNDVSRLPDFIKRIKTADLVIGSRYAPGGGVENWSWWRRLLSRTANFTLSLISLTFNISEFTNLYRAFDKKVWEKIKDKVSVHKDWLFVPAFIFEALGTKFKIVEIPYIFKDRFGGRSKMRTVSYTVDLLRYAIRFRLQKSASFFKFLVVGGLGFIINTTVLIVGVNFGMVPANAGALGAEFAIISNFILNNLWTFADRKVTTPLEIIKKFIPFNVLSFGSAIIQFLFLKAGELIFGLEHYKASLWYMLFYIAGVAVGLVWNYIMYSKVIWKKKK
ncbi:MAG: glycosyltransferase [bacterium]|nr:glycosyltransferase [bacterium]